MFLNKSSIPFVIQVFGMESNDLGTFIGEDVYFNGRSANLKNSNTFLVCPKVAQRRMIL